MTTILTLVGARGGSGASTVAAALALHTAEDVPTALLTHDPTAMARLLGTTGAVPAPTHPFAVGPRLTVAGLEGPRHTLTIIDAGLLAGRPSEIPGLGHLSDTLVRGVEPFTAIPKMAVDRVGHDVARNGANHAASSGWGHEL